MLRFRVLSTGIAGLTLAGIASGAVTIGALAQDTPATDLVGAWQSTDEKALYLFEAGGGYSVIGWRREVLSGTYEILSVDGGTTIHLSPHGYVRFSGDGGAGHFRSIELTPEAAAASTEYAEFVHGSAADPRPSQEPLAIDGSWIAQDGSAVLTFEPKGVATLVMLGEYSDFTEGSPGTRRTLGYKFQPAPGGGVLSLAMGEQRMDFEVAAFGPDVMMIDDLPSDGMDLDTLREEGGEISFLRVVDVP